MIDVKFSMFFDRERVQRRVKDGTKSVLSKAGAYIRRTARKSMGNRGKRNKSARPGQAPRVHAGQLKDLLFFGYDERTNSVVIGPQLYGRSTNPTVPHLLEFGGSVSRTDKHGRQRVYHYHAFPYMRPALEKEMPNFPGLFSGSIKE